MAALAPGQQAAYYAGVALGAGNFSAGATSVFVPDPYQGSYSPDALSWVGTAVVVPVGSIVDSVDFSIYGVPRTGGMGVDVFTPDNAGPSISTTSPVSSAIGLATFVIDVGRVCDGSNAFFAYYYGGSATSVCRGIRVRYTPPRATKFVAVAPKRVYDSRFNMGADASGVLSSPSGRTVSVANGRNAAGVVDAPNLVPTNAVSVAYTLTVAGTVGDGYLAVNPGGDSVIKASTINWQGGQVLANTTVTALGASRDLTVIAGQGSTHFLIDVVGYYVY